MIPPTMPASQEGSIQLLTWNIHKGVRGVGRRRRLEVEQIARAIQSLGVDIVCLQEVRNSDKRHAAYFSHWPQVPQAEFLCPSGYQVAYSSNAFDAHGEHGNALMSTLPILSHRQQDVSDHRFEQRGLLYVCLDWAQAGGKPLHVVVLHLGLIGVSRLRQIEMLKKFIRENVPEGDPLIVAGDFNDWAERLHRPLLDMGLQTWTHRRIATFPARAPALYLDRVYARGLRVVQLEALRTGQWARMSDHLPLLATLAP